MQIISDHPVKTKWLIHHVQFTNNYPEATAPNVYREFTDHPLGGRSIVLWSRTNFIFMASMKFKYIYHGRSSCNVVMRDVNMDGYTITYNFIPRTYELLMNTAGKGMFHVSHDLVFTGTFTFEKRGPAIWVTPYFENNNPPESD